ncbi:MAG TPA: D-glycerate dehydrogenase [Rhabdochlamydiaceae bacterium]|jgi:glyoxylate reductase|nr:D-glycerate dehydrogenase [Rhabdochlamydiaceae bacterium]
MHKIYITRQMPAAREVLRGHFDVEENLQDRILSREELKQVVRQFDGVLSTIADKLDRDVLESAEQLKVISNYAAGLDNVDQVVAKERKIAVYNVPDATTQSTADMTFAILLSLIRKVAEAEAYVKQGLWKAWEPNLFLGEELYGKYFGIIGFGKIGKAVAERALGFGLKVLAFARSKIDYPRVQQASLEELYKKSDFISIHVPLTEETKGLINWETMKKMEQRPVIINMARGAVVCTDDLARALKEGIVRGAALDVTDPEPISASHPLCHLKNCLIVPHIGSATVECRTLLAREAAKNLIRYFNDQP